MADVWGVLLVMLGGVPLEDVQTLVGHSQPQTTALYDRRERRIARSVVERISI